eukprot:gnl/Carplike_NY0171/7664_a10582_229.p1 GENE.gnl/Carplike_NY0171/7664_a10582_229~~gnl/Carplike_NY0171/7664_a10582_229.p1  ORF type:complete len:244 (-),score=39.73 gnl/Carplike_NY0171/7664_a10582_229:28-726(-)
MVKLSMQACVSEDDDELAKKVGMFRLYVKIIIRLKHIMAKKEESQMSHSDMVSPCSSSLDKLSSLALGLLLTSLKLPASLLALRYRLHLLSLTVDMCTKFKLSSLAQRIAPPLQLALQKMKAKMGDQLVSMCEKTMEKYETMIKSGVGSLDVKSILSRIKSVFCGSYKCSNCGKVCEIDLLKGSCVCKQKISLCSDSLMLSEESSIECQWCSCLNGKVGDTCCVCGKELEMK